MVSKKEKMELETVEEELSLLMEITIKLEDELNSFVQMDNE